MNKLNILSFTGLNAFPFLVHGFSTRSGGYSTKPYHELNLGLHCGDQKQAVYKNRRLYYNQLGIPQDRLVYPAQIHSENIVCVQQPGIVNDCDALITDRKNLFLTIQTADCIPVFIVDPVQQVVAIVHSGWRGTAKNIAGKTVGKLVSEYNCNPENLFAAIGPGVQQNCYQVDDKTAANFPIQVLIADGPGHFKLNVPQAIRGQLIHSGIPIKQLEQDRTCTHCATDKYYSYRRDGKDSGRMMGVIGMRG